jgi:hemerythrin-like domain-containing protein
MASTARCEVGTLTPDQRKLIQQAGGEVLRLVDPDTSQQYVLLRADLYEQLRSSHLDLNPSDFYPALNRAMRDEGWDDPQMDEYNRYG